MIDTDDFDPDETLIAEYLIDNSSMWEAIDEAIRDYVWKQKEAYGIHYDPKTIKVNPWQFKDQIQKWLDKQYEIYYKPFEHENEATEQWLEDEGYDLIMKAIES